MYCKWNKQGLNIVLEEQRQQYIFSMEVFGPHSCRKFARWLFDHLTRSGGDRGQ